nr:hypothetical protein [Tanacetum cinerariifolium]
FEDIKYVDASVPNPAIISVEEENVVKREEEENDNSDSSNGPLLEEVDLFLFDDSIPPGIENVVDDPEGDDNPSISRPPPDQPDDNFDLEPEDYPPEIEVILCRICVRFPRSSYPLIDFSLGRSISF